MDLRERQQKIKFLIGLILVGALFYVLLSLHVPLTGTPQVDGILGVLLGFFTCAHPAYNGLNLILYRRDLANQNLPRGVMNGWYAANLGALLTGILVTVAGLMRYARL